VFVYHKHKSEKNLQHKYMQKIFWKYVSSRWHSKHLASKVNTLLRISRMYINVCRKFVSNQ